MSKYSFSPQPVRQNGKKINEAADESSLEMSVVTQVNEAFEDETVSWTHLSLPFLEPSKIKDINGRRPDHPEYDSHTLYVPEEFKVCTRVFFVQYFRLNKLLACGSGGN